MGRELALLDRETEIRLESPFVRHFPDCTPACRDPQSDRREDHAGFCRVLYRKHLLFMAAGRKHRERLCIAANRVGKTDSALYELTAHLTGLYPEWWEGHRFEPRPNAQGMHINAWVAGDTGKTVRDIIQAKVVGPARELGKGMLTSEYIEHATRKQGINEAIETVWVKHVEHHHGMPLISQLDFRSYDQRREAFQGTAQDLILLDEEPPSDIYEECLQRTMATGHFPGGKILMTFTPLQGFTDVVRKFLPDGRPPAGGIGIHEGRFIANIPWEEAPHLSPEECATMEAGMPPHLRDARTKGIPVLGSGLVYITPEDRFTVKAFTPPAEWPRGYGMDVGWKHDTAVVFLAYDRASDTVYLYHEYKQAQQPPGVHAQAIRRKAGDWMPGQIDPSANTGNQVDGTKLYEEYRSEGLRVSMAPRALEAGITNLQKRLSEGRFKVMDCCTQWLSEYRSYHRDTDGKIVKKGVGDDLLDATRYFLNASDDHFSWLRTPPEAKAARPTERRTIGRHGWMAG